MKDFIVKHPVVAVMLILAVSMALRIIFCGFDFTQKTPFTTTTLKGMADPIDVIKHDLDMVVDKLVSVNKSLKMLDSASDNKYYQSLIKEISEAQDELKNIKTNLNEIKQNGKAITK